MFLFDAMVSKKYYTIFKYGKHKQSNVKTMELLTLAIDQEIQYSKEIQLCKARKWSIVIVVTRFQSILLLHHTL